MKPIIVAAVALAVSALPILADDKDDKIDKKVTEIVKRTGELYKNAKSIHVEGTVVSKIDNNGEKRETKASVVYDSERPNRVSLKSQLDGDAKKGPDVISDGKNLTIYRKALKQYVQEEAPDNVAEIGLRVLRLGPAMVGMLFAHVVAEDPADLLMQGVNSCSYVGLDKVDGVPAHHMKFSQDQFDWEMWVAAEGKPFILQMLRIAEGENGKVRTTETYKNWKLDEATPKQTFTFVPPKDASKVDEFQEGQ
jgi:hypothetical protein